MYGVLTTVVGIIERFSDHLIVELLIQWERGEEVSHVVNFEDRARLHQLFTDRRMERPPESIRALADQLDRDVHDIHDEIYLLAKYDIIHFEEDGRAKKPYVPYDTIRLEVEFGLSSSERSGLAASAWSLIRTPSRSPIFSLQLSG